MMTIEIRDDAGNYKLVEMRWTDLIALIDNNGWRPIETVPRDGTIVGLARGKEMTTGFFDDQSTPYPSWAFLDADLRMVNSYHKDECPTHWRPLPDPPK